MPSPLINMVSYLIAGASRGIGLALVERLSAQSTTSIIYAGVRNPDAASSQLVSDPKVRVIKFDVLSQADVDAATTAVETETGSLDVLIFNAGAATEKSTAHSSVADVQAMVDLNIVAPHRAFQAFLPLIRKGHAKKIIAIGTVAGSFALSQQFSKVGFPLSPYGVSKAGLHFLTLSYSNDLTAEGIIVASIHPGVVDTEGARLALQHLPEGTMAKIKEMGVKMLTTTESADSIIKVINEIKPEKSGDLLDVDGSTLPF